jgi:hypothetical protein
MNRETSSEKTGCKIILILLIAVAVLSNAMNDLNRLQELTSSLQEFTAEWLGDGLTTANAKDNLLDKNSCLSEATVPVNSADEFRWNGSVAPGKTIEIKGLNGDIKAEPATGSELEVSANKKGRRSDPGTVRIQVVEHADGVTICAIYPSDDPDQPNTCEPGEQHARGNSSATNNVHNNDVRVDFLVRVPAGVTFAGHTINGEIRASSLSGNVESRTVNGSINISTSGYAQAKTVNGEISAKLGNANWSGVLEFKTLNGGINLDLPSTISTEINAETLNGQISSDFPLTLLGNFDRKRVSGRIGSGGRELVLKTLNGSINLRRAI